MQQKIIRYVCVNDRGMRIGEHHPGSKLSDADIEKIRDLREYGGWSYGRIAREYGVTRGCIAKICLYERRVETIAGFKKVEQIVEVEEA